ncbi:MAG: hypothetical protein J5544_00275 [Clostridia bacterium]|nr:hypothetical protein [Clostridia bacterium]
MKCPNCGKEVTEAEKFCTGCGCRLDNIRAEAMNVAEELDATVRTEAAPAQPVYQNPPAPQPPVYAPYPETPVVPAEEPKAKKEKKQYSTAPCKPLSTWAFFWRTFVFCIPVIGLILMFILSFNKSVNANSRSFARSCLIYALIGLVIAIACGILFYIFYDQIIDFTKNLINQFLNQ